MADNKIQYKDFVDGKKILTDWEADLKRMETAVKKSFKRIKKEAKGLFVDTSDPGKLQKDIEKLQKLVKDLSATKKAQKTINNELAASEKKLIASTKEGSQVIADNSEQTKKNRRERSLQSKVNTGAAGSLQKLKAETNLLNSKLEKLNLNTKAGRKQAKLWQKQILANTAALKKADAAIGRHNRHVGNYAMGLKNLGRQLLGAAGVVGGVMLFTSAVRSAIRVTAEYDKNLASLSAITGLVGKDLAFFAKAAKKMSGETVKSINEIIKAFERVGSLRPELLKDKEALVEVTNAAIVLSESTGGFLSLEEAANATAGAMNQFGIKSSEALRVVNALAAGSLKGSATTQQLSESFKNFGAVADAANISLEESIGLVELAATKMIVGTEAGTAIRGSILRLQAASLGYASGQFNMNDAIDEANAKLDEFGSQMLRDQFMLDTFGVRNILFGQTLLDNKEKFNELTEEVTNTTTALEQQEKQNDTLSGSWSRLGASWDSFVTGGSGVVNFLKGTLDGISELLSSEVTFWEYIAFGGKLEEGIGFWEWIWYGRKGAAGIASDAELIVGATGKLSAGAKAMLGVAEEAGETWSWIDDATFQFKKLLDEEETQITTINTLTEELNALKEARSDINVEDTQALIINAQLTAALEKQIKLAREENGRIKELIKLKKKEAGPVILDDGSTLVGPVPEDVLTPRDGADAEIAATKYSEDEKKAMIQAGIDAAYTLYDGFFNWMTNRRMAQLNEVEGQRARELNLAGDNLEQIGAINEKYDKKRSALRRKQAKQDKIKALFDVGINTAVGISAAIPNPFLIAFAALMGAIQLAVVASKPIPAYRKGVKSKKDSGWAIVNEGGEEMIIHPSGHVEMTSGGHNPEAKWLDEGTEVVPNPEVQKRLAAMSDRSIKPYNDRMNTARMEQLQADQLLQQQKTNELLGRFKWSDGKRVFDLDGNTVTYV